MSKKRFEVFDDVESASHRIKELDANGLPQEYITVFSKHTLPTEFTREFDVKIRMGEGNPFQKFESLFTEETGEERATEDIHMSDIETEKYHKALQSGQIVAFINYGGVSESFDEMTDSNEQHVDLSQRNDY